MTVVEPDEGGDERGPRRQRRTVAAVVLVVFAIGVLLVATVGRAVWTRTTTETLVDYAEGHWACDLAITTPRPPAGEGFPIPKSRWDATVGVTEQSGSNASGTIVLELPEEFPFTRPGFRGEFSGTWRLDNGDLQVRFDHDNL